MPSLFLFLLLKLISDMQHFDAEKSRGITANIRVVLQIRRKSATRSARRKAAKEGNTNMPFLAFDYKLFLGKN